MYLLLCGQDARFKGLLGAAIFITTYNKLLDEMNNTLAFCCSYSSTNSGAIKVVLVEAMGSF